MDPSLPATLTDAMATEPFWIRGWLVVLVVTNFASVLFAVGREAGRWHSRLPLRTVAAPTW